MDANIFTQIAEIATGAKTRRDREYADFLSFYRALVESLSADAVELFGKMNVKVYTGGSTSDFGLLLTASDYLFWKRHLEQEGTRFVERVGKVRVRMIERMAEKAESQRLEPSERAKIIALVSNTPEQVPA